MEVNLEEFQKLELKVAEVKSVEDIPGSDKLYKLTLDIGGKTKQIVAGIKGSYKKDELFRKQIIIIDNLKPAILRGVESNGMLLAAEGESGPVILIPEKRVKPGSRIK